MLCHSRLTNYGHSPARDVMGDGLFPIQRALNNCFIKQMTRCAMVCTLSRRSYHGREIRDMGQKRVISNQIYGYGGLESCRTQSTTTLLHILRQWKKNWWQSMRKSWIHGCANNSEYAIDALKEWCCATRYSICRHSKPSIANHCFWSLFLSLSCRFLRPWLC